MYIVYMFKKIYTFPFVYITEIESRGIYDIPGFGLWRVSRMPEYITGNFSVQVMYKSYCERSE